MLSEAHDGVDEGGCSLGVKLFLLRTIFALDGHSQIIQQKLSHARVPLHTSANVRGRHVVEALLYDRRVAEGIGRIG